MSEFLAMGGHAWYVWGSYAVTFILMGVEIVWVLKREAKA
jgi:heme exporter protein CcmD